jgi:hypothetical protein
MSLSFGGAGDAIELPPLSTGTGALPQAPVSGETDGNARVELRPVGANGKARREARVSELARISAANAELRRELDRVTEVANIERAEREKYHTTSVVLARRVADMYSERASAIAARDQLSEECARLAQELARARSALGAPSELPALSEPAPQPIRLARVV